MIHSKHCLHINPAAFSLAPEPIRWDCERLNVSHHYVLHTLFSYQSPNVSTVILSPLQKKLLNDYQQDFPLSPRPYLQIAEHLGITENEVLFAFQVLSEHGFITRIGSIVQPNKISASSLVAMKVPESKLHSVAKIINQFSEVNHNYQREHEFNLWFVLIAPNSVHLKQTLAEIERLTGFKTLNLPLLDEYFINLGFQMCLDD